VTREGAGLFALIDCNNFYASCERVFRPDLEGRPVAVLSNNDGCIVARSGEVKALGVPMGAPYFKFRDVLQRHDVQVFSSNYELYGDMSARVMTVLSRFSSDVEIYSIDEAFLALDGFVGWDVMAHAHELRATVKQWTGIPVSVGIAPTKTLAKLAAERAKKAPELGGVFVMPNRPQDRETALAATPVGDVWGIGRRWSKRLAAQGVMNALDFTREPEHWVRSNMGVGGARTQAELLGTACFGLDSQPHDRKSCVVSRSFAHPVTDFEGLKDAVATFAARAGERLRQGGLVAGQVTAFALTDRFNAHQAPHQAAATVALDSPTNLTADITRAALNALQHAYRSGVSYKKAGVMMLDLAPESAQQPTLFAPLVADQDKAARLQSALDSLNAACNDGRNGRRDLVRLGATGFNRNKTGSWQLRRDHTSPRYTTSWAELRTVRAG